MCYCLQSLDPADAADVVGAQHWVSTCELEGAACSFTERKKHVPARLTICLTCSVLYHSKTHLIGHLK